MKELEVLEQAAGAFNLNDTIQFHHDQYNGYTYAIDVGFNREDLLETVHHFDQPIAFKIGMSTLHPNDNYCKATGREVSAGKMKPVMLYLDGIHKHQVPLGVDNDDKLYLQFKDPITYTYYTFRVNNKSDKVHFIKVYQVENY